MIIISGSNLIMLNKELENEPTEHEDLLYEKKLEEKSFKTIERMTLRVHHSDNAGLEGVIECIRHRTMTT